MAVRSSESLAVHHWALLTGFAVLLLCSVLYGDGCSSSWVRDFCASSDLLCFPSTVLGSGSGIGEECLEKKLIDRDGGVSRKWRGGNSAGFALGNGDVVSCSVVNMMSGVDDRLRFDEKSAVDFGSSCKAPLIPDVWMKMASGMMPELDEEGDDLDSGFLNASSSLHVEISPPFLDWGEVHLYSPSILSLVVKNVDKNTILQVLEPFSSDPLFYPYDFGRVLLPPGESVSISFVFLPRLLGSVVAHVVLQTSLGGFVIQARGVAVESPYKIEPLIGLGIPFNGKLNKDLRLHNPFDNVLYIEEVSAWVTSSGASNHSEHFVCSINASDQLTSGQSNLLDGELFRVNDGELELPLIDIRPHKHWEILAESTQSILSMSFWHKLDGNIFGAICFKLRSLSLDSTDVVIVPLELNMLERTIYKDQTELISVYLEPLVRRDGKNQISSLVLRNDATDSLKVTNVSEVNESSKFFAIKQIQGLIVFPAMVTPIAVISCTAAASDINLHQFPDESLNCKLSIVTNHSSSSAINIPCQDMIYACLNGEHVTGIAASEESYMELRQPQQDESSEEKTGTFASTGEVPNHPQELLETVEANELILKNWRSQGIATDLSILEDHELLFSAVEVGSHAPKWISVRNPSQSPILVQLLLNPIDIVDRCKSEQNMSDNNLFTKLQSQEPSIGFSVSDSGITEGVVHSFESALFGPVLFRPSNRCMWTSSALLRNNLSGVETLHLQAFGGIQLLILLEGSEPFRKLEFNFDMPTKLNTSSTNSSHKQESSCTSCSHRLSKEVHAKNIGELPLVVNKLKVSGTDCGLDGFKIHKCKAFALEPGESMKLQISYQSDFSVAQVNRNLELFMSSGIFIIPMTATVPVHAINICRRSFFRSFNWKLSCLVLIVVTILLVVTVRVIPHSFFWSSLDYTRLDKPTGNADKGGKSSRVHRTSKNSRLTRDDGKPDAGSLLKYPISQKNMTDGPSGLSSKKELDEDSTRFSTQTLANKPAGVIDSSSVPEASENGDLTIRVVKDRNKRKKRRGTGATLGGKFDVSSSQSGNSTPSSPLSPNSSTPKQAWIIPADSARVPSPGLSPEKKQPEKQDVEFQTGVNLKCVERELRLQSDLEQASLKNSAMMPLHGSAYPFPGMGWEDPSAVGVVPKFSTVAPDARAPGPKNNKSKSMTVEKDHAVAKEYTYDIWGNHFPTDIWGKPKEVTTDAFDASEGDSQSFFARDPQSLMMMSSAKSQPPGRKLTSSDVTYKNQMN